MNPVPVYLPKETVSDDRYLITRLYVENGSQVNKGDLLLTFETSKAAVDLEAAQTGFFFTRLQEGQEVPIGALAGLIAEASQISPEDWPTESALPLKQPPSIPLPKEHALPTENLLTPHADVPMPTGQRISHPAQTLIQQQRLDLHLFDGLPLVRREDVQRILDGQTPVAKSSSKPSIFILGGGGHAKMCLDILAQTAEYQVVGILDRGLEIGSQVLGIPVLGPDSDENLARLYQQGVRLAINGIGAAGSHPFRSKVYQRLRQAGFNLPNLVHPSATIEPSAVLGVGNQIMAGAVIGSSAQIGNNCIINSNAVVSHDSHLADNVHIAPGALLAGNVQIGADTLVGMGVTLFLGLKIGSRVVITNGLNIFKDVPDETYLRH